MTVAKQDQQLDTLRFENRSFKNQIEEMKKDCYAVSGLLEEEDGRTNKLSEREK